MNNKLLDSIRFYFAQTVFNTQCQYCAYHRYEANFKKLNWFVYISSSVTIVLLICQIIGLQLNSEIWLSIVALIGLFVTGASLVFTMITGKLSSKEMYNHKTYGEKYKTIRDEFMCLIEEVMSNEGKHDKLRIKRDDLLKKYSSIGELAPSTNNEDYIEAQKSLGLKGDGETFTWDDVEIDRFLPKYLKLTN